MTVRANIHSVHPPPRWAPLDVRATSIIFFLVLALSPLPSPGQEVTEKILQEAVYREQIEGDLQGAIKIYEQIISRTPKNDSLHISAKLRLATCYEKRGDERALAIYREIIRSHPNRADACRIAKARLATLSDRAPDFSALVDQYIGRVSVERLGAVSPDGSLEAHTDWSTGNLIVKNRKSGRITELTHKTWNESPEFAHYKVWSPDGKKIAYGWYRPGPSIGLRIISVDGGKPEIILEHDSVYVFPSDWSRDGTKILARIGRLGLGSTHMSLTLSTIDISTGVCTPLITLDGDARGLQFSPDGRFIALDRIGEEEKTREVYTLSLPDRKLTKISGGIIGEKDTPLWSVSGRHILFRATASGTTLLMAVPAGEGTATGKPYLLHMNLRNEIQRRAGIERQQLVSGMEKLEQASLLTDRPALETFEDNFESARLDPAWKVIQWEGPNVYGFKSFGRISVSDRPGHLRYYLDPMALWMLPLSRTMFGEAEGYWYYPALQVRRKLAGTSWVLETKVTYGLDRPADGRYCSLGILFTDNGTLTGNVSIERIRAWEGHPTFSISLGTPGKLFDRVSSFTPPGDTLESLPYACHIRIIRQDTLMNVEMSDDGISYARVASSGYPREALGNEQQLLIIGGGWFTPAGAYADFDYFRFRQILKQ